MALAERTWERVGERKRDRARLIESADKAYNMCLFSRNLFIVNTNSVVTYPVTKES